MTLPEACEVLNRHNYGGRSDWRVERNTVTAFPYIDGDFSAFEALAVAEKYVRDTEYPPTEREIARARELVAEGR